MCNETNNLSAEAKPEMQESPHELSPSWLWVEVKYKRSK